MTSNYHASFMFSYSFRFPFAGLSLEHQKQTHPITNKMYTKVVPFTDAISLTTIAAKSYNSIQPIVSNNNGDS